MVAQGETLMIKDIKKMAAGTEIKGLPLMIKTARKPFTEAGGQTYQEVIFMDSSGEMTGNILLDPDIGCVPWKSKTNICIMLGEIQDTDERRKESVKLVVYECFDAATPLSYDQGQELQAEDWKQLRQDEIKGKIRHGLVCALVPRMEFGPHMAVLKLTDGYKQDINNLVDFIMTGQ